MTRAVQTILEGVKRPAPWEAVRFDPAWRVGMLGPHPDDFDAVAVALRRLFENGNPIAVAVASGSASGVLDSFVGADPAAKREARENEQRASVRFFGLDDDRLAFLRLEEDDKGDPIENETAEATIAQWMERERVDLVFLPHGNDTNAGHQRVWRMFRKAAGRLNRRIVAFYNRDPKTIAMREDIYVSFDEPPAQWKRELLLHHASQEHRNRTLRGCSFPDRLLEAERAAGSALGLDGYAEVFEVEMLGGQMPERRV